MLEDHGNKPTEVCPAQLQRAAEYIQEHYIEALTLEQLASVACYSKYHFHRLFRDHFGETVNDYIRRVRLEQAACRLATDLNASVSQIAQACGFSSSQNFAKAFRAHFGISPTSARQNPVPWLCGKTYHPKKADQDHPSFSAEIKDFPSLRVARMRSIDAESAEAQSQCADRLMAWAFTKGFIEPESKMIAVGRKELSADISDPFLFDPCMTVSEKAEDEGDIFISSLTACRCAVLRCEEEAYKIIAIRKYLTDVWLPASGFRRDVLPFFVIFHNHPGMNPRGLAVMDLCLPLKP